MFKDYIIVTIIIWFSFKLYSVIIILTLFQPVDDNMTDNMIDNMITTDCYQYFIEVVIIIIIHNDIIMIVQLWIRTIFGIVWSPIGWNNDKKKKYVTYCKT